MTPEFAAACRADPFLLLRTLWPHREFFDKQRQMVESVWFNKETVVVAGNQLGKDYTAGYIIPAYFLAHDPCRIMISSVSVKQLGVLRGEIERWIDESRVPLRSTQGGPLYYTEDRIRKVYTSGPRKGQFVPLSYVRSAVPEKRETLQGHHARYTLAVFDEASGVPDMYYEATQGWAKKTLVFGNPEQCENFFRRAVRGGDLLAEGSAV